MTNLTNFVCLPDHFGENGDKPIRFVDRSGAEQSFALAEAREHWIDYSERSENANVLSWLPDGCWVHWDFFDIRGSEVLSEPVAIQLLLARGETPPECDALRALETYSAPTEVFDLDTGQIRFFNRSKCQYWTNWTSERLPVRTSLQKIEDCAFDAMSPEIIESILFRHPDGTWTLGSIHSHFKNYQLYSTIQTISDVKAVDWMLRNNFTIPAELICLAPAAMREDVPKFDTEQLMNPVTVSSGNKSTDAACGLTLDPLQQQILEVLNGKSMRVQALADKCGVEKNRLYKLRSNQTKPLQELRDAGLIQLDSKIGYFRPDAPPPSVVQTRTQTGTQTGTGRPN